MAAQPDDQGQRSDGSQPTRSARIVAGYVVLGAAIALFLCDAVSLRILGYKADLAKPAWALLAMASYYWLGTSLTQVVGGVAQIVEILAQAVARRIESRRSDHE